MENCNNIFIDNKSKKLSCLKIKNLFTKKKEGNKNKIERKKKLKNIEKISIIYNFSIKRHLFL
jgi:hypothetical protein